ncbi:MAG: aminotransferase class V-fold PLP-dependent enzyme [Proteobacteria bacterium]|nr:aminotransferase class V-fold PLP-dependent enzyme [Pseudomonadota bacterium]
MRAIVLADERSPRPVNGSGHVRALAKVAGLPLIVRNLRTLHAAGVEEAVVVTGYKASRISEALGRYHLGIHVTEIFNPHWERGSAHSVIVAAKYINGPCLLVPSDHLYPPSLVRRMLNFPASVDSMVLAVDRRIDDVFDENECIKVKVSGGLATDVGMNLTSPDAFAPGMVRISIYLIETLRRLVPDADLSVLDCLRAMARRDRVRTLDVENARWISISSPQARCYAELLLKLHGDTLETSDTGDAFLLSPGPVTTTPRVKAAVGARDMCHREPVFSSLLDSVQRKLRTVFGATEDHDIMLVTASGTGGLESAISTFIPEGRPFLVVRNGAFGERMADIARTYGINVIEVALEWGEEITLDKIERALKENPDIAAVGIVHHETSIGVLNPVSDVSRLAHKYGATSIVDSVSSLGGEDIDVYRDEIDVCIASANKCLHAFSGLASICVHKDVWQTIESDSPRSYYLDLRRYREYMIERRQTPFTPAVNTLMSLNAALDELLEMGLKARHEHYHRISQYLRDGLESLGLNLLVHPERASHVLTLVEVPEDLTYQDVYHGLKDRGFIVYECKGELAGRYFQVANMGAIEEAHVDEFLAALKDYLIGARQTEDLRSAGLRVV